MFCICENFRPFLEKEENLDADELSALRLEDDDKENSESNGLSSSPSKTVKNVLTDGQNKSAKDSTLNEDDIENFDENGAVNGSSSGMANGHAENGVSVNNNNNNNNKRYYFKISCVYPAGNADAQKLTRNGKFEIPGSR